MDRLPPSLDPERLATLPGFRYWFRYPLHARDFHALREDNDRLLGYYAAKPLYGKLDAHGRVDRSGGFDGRIAVVFVPSPARSLRHARLLLARAPREQLRRRDGRRDWRRIRASAERALRRQLAATPA
jgi:hypothetical protein